MSEWNNLDRLAARIAQKIVAEGGDAGKLEILATKTLGVVQDDYRKGPRPWSNDRPITRQAVKQNGTWQENSPAGRPIYPDPQNVEQPAKEDGREKGWRRPLDVVRAGLELAELLGLGGMGTRGFGRVRLIADWGLQVGGGR